MKHCDKCNVNVRGNETVCPLCQNILSGKDEEAIYPEVPTLYKQFNLFFKLLILYTIIGCVICVAVNIILPQSGYWSVFVLLGSFCFWIALAYAVKKKDNIAKDITVLIFIASALCVLWDWSTGWYGWSLNFAFPIACSFAMVALAVMAKVLKLQGGDYIIYLFVDVFFGAVPILFYVAGLISIMIPSVICIALSVVSISALIIFERKNLLDEIKKNLHL